MSLDLPLNVTTQEIQSIHGVVVRYFQGDNFKRIIIPTRGSEVIESMEFRSDDEDIFLLGTCDHTEPIITLTPNFARMLEKAEESEFGKCDINTIKSRIESESKALRLKIINTIIKNRNIEEDGFFCQTI